MSSMLIGCGSTQPESAADQIKAVYTSSTAAIGERDWPTACSQYTPAGQAQQVQNVRKLLGAQTPDECAAALTALDAKMTAAGGTSKDFWDRVVASAPGSTLSDLNVAGDSATATSTPAAGSPSTSTQIQGFKKLDGKWLVDTDHS
ncbi:MAG: hypothetical protein WCI34_04250 [Actinomycetes bacterium]